MMTATSMLPSGKFAGAWRNRKTAPTATFIPSVFMINASISETSRTRPVALRRKTPVVPPLLIDAAVLIPLPSFAPLSGADQMKDTVLAMKTLDGEAETIRSIDHTRKFERTIGRVVRRALHLEGGRARDQAEQLCLFLAANDLDGAGRPSGDDAVEHLHRPIERVLGQLGVHDLGKSLRGEIGVEQGNGFAFHRRQPADQEELPLRRTQRVPDRRVGGDQTSEPDVDARVEPFGTHALGEARKDRDLLIDLRL